jgi:hypothetical protein
MLVAILCAGAVLLGLVLFGKGLWAGLQHPCGCFLGLVCLSIALILGWLVMNANPNLWGGV